MKNLKLKKTKLRHKLRRRKNSDNKPEYGEGVPRITTDTIAVHREDILSGARKYIYPLQHAKHRIITITVTILVLSIIGFFGYCTLALYRFHSTSSFIYRVTQVIPFPVARAGGTFISYESYLFEIRHYTHYYETQLKTDFNENLYKPQLAAFKQQALDKVVADAYIKKLAEKYNISVTDQQINDQIVILRNQNRLGSSDKVFEDVLQDYWGWSVEDFKRSLRSQLLGQNVVAALDTQTTDRANEAYKELQAGAAFEKVVEKYTDDESTKASGGDIGIIDRTKREITAQTAGAIFDLKPGEYSIVLNIGYSLEIVKNLETASDSRIHAAHILFNFKDIDTYINDLKEQQKATVYIKP